MQTHSDDQNPQLPGPWWKSSRPVSPHHLKSLYQSIDKFADEISFSGATDTISELLECYLAEVESGGDAIAIASLANVTSRTMSFLHQIGETWQDLEYLSLRDRKLYKEKPTYTSLNALQQHIQLLWVDLEKAKYEKDREKAQRISDLIVELSKLNAENVGSLNEARTAKWRELVDKFHANQELTVVDPKPVQSNTSETLDICINQLCKEIEEAKTHRDSERVNALSLLIARVTEISDESGLDTNPAHVKECAALIKQFRKDYPATDPVPAVSELTALELAIEEVWGWYKEVKSRYGIQKPEVEEMLAVWISFIGNLAEYTSFTNPNDYDWQKRLDDYREQYEGNI